MSENFLLGYTGQTNLTSYSCKKELGLVKVASTNGIFPCIFELLPEIHADAASLALAVARAQTNSANHLSTSSVGLPLSLVV